MQGVKKAGKGNLSEDKPPIFILVERGVVRIMCHQVV